VLPSDLFDIAPLDAPSARRHLPVYVEPQTDEALCSWLCRLSARLGTTPCQMGKWAFQINAHVDRHWWRRPDEPTLARIAERAGLPIARVRAMTLLDYASAHADEAPGRFHARRSRHVGDSVNGGKPIMVCPQCLAGDTDPYIRLSWTFSWTGICPEHRRHMLSRCPTCVAPIRMPQMYSDAVPELGACTQCGTAFSDAKLAPRARLMAITLQEELTRAKREGYGQFAGMEGSWAEIVTCLDLILTTLWKHSVDYRREHLFQRVMLDLGGGLNDHLQIDWTDTLGALRLIEWLAGAPDERGAAALSMLQAPTLWSIARKLTDLESRTRKAALAMLPRSALLYRPGRPAWKQWLETLPSSAVIYGEAWKQFHETFRRRLSIIAYLRDNPSIEDAAQTHGLHTATIQRMLDYAATYGLEIILRRPRRRRDLTIDEQTSIEEWLRTVHRPANPHGWSANHAQWEIAARFGIQLSVALVHEMLVKMKGRRRASLSLAVGQAAAPASIRYAIG
jgi:transposase